MLRDDGTRRPVVFLPKDSGYRVNRFSFPTYTDDLDSEELTRYVAKCTSGMDLFGTDTVAINQRDREHYHTGPCALERFAITINTT